MIPWSDFPSQIPVLLQDPEIRAKVEEELAPKLQPLTLANLEALGADLSADIEACFEDMVVNEAEEVAWFTGYGSYGGFPITVMRFGHLYYVTASEFDDSDLYLSQSDAEEAAEGMYWEYINPPGGLCPICGNPYDWERFEEQPCGHWLFTIDDSDSLLLCCAEEGNLGEEDFRALQVALDRALQSAPLHEVLEKAQKWKWNDPALHKWVCSTAALSIENGEPCIPVEESFAYLGNVLEASGLSYQWTCENEDLPGAAIGGRLWSPVAGGLDEHLCSVFTKAQNALIAFACGVEGAIDLS